jgi:ComF family protein
MTAALRWRPIAAGVRSAVDLLYPPACPWCRAEGLDPAETPATGLCRECRVSLIPTTGDWCPRCAAPVGPYAVLEQGCHHCQAEGYRFRSAVTLGHYSGDLTAAIVAGKGAQGESLILALTEELLAVRRDWFERTPVDIVIPVPHHWTRRLASGHLASETMAHRLARRLNRPCWQDAVAKLRWTPRQKDRSATERRTGLRHAFAATGRPLAGKRVLLVDDVMTTGGTAQAVSRALLRGGAAEVHIAVLARSVTS